jgi:hypothetical protein
MHDRCDGGSDANGEKVPAQILRSGRPSKKCKYRLEECADLAIL